MAKTISLLLILMLSLPASASIMERLLAYETSEVTYEDLPCISPQLYQQIKPLMSFDYEGIEGELCGDGSLKERIGKYATMLWNEMNFILKAVRENPEEALTDTRPLVVYPTLSCISEENYQYYKDLLDFSDDNLPGELCDNSLRSRFGKLIEHFRKVPTYYTRAFTMNLLSTLTSPYNLLISALINGQKYEGSLTPSPNAPALKGFSDYDQLPCISEDLYREIKKVMHVDDSQLGGDLCGDDSNKERFGKLLLYLKKLAIKLPLNWKGGASDALVNPLNYIAHRSSSLSFDDKSDEGTIASNWGNGSLSFYNLYFTLKPLDAIGVLIHEARHSDGDDPSHVPCLAGDRARQSKTRLDGTKNGACDQWLDTGKKAGAYSYGLSFYYAVAKYGLSSQVSDEDREYLQSLALTLMALRFNAVPDFLGLPFETVHLLNSDGDHYYLHPIMKKMIPIEHEQLINITRLKFDRVRNGLHAFTEDGKVFKNKNFNFQFKAIDENIIPSDIQVRDIERLTSKKTSITYFVTDENEIRQTSFDPKKQAKTSIRSPFQYFQDDIVSLVHGNDQNRYALTKGGVLLRFEVVGKGEEEESNLIDDKFQDPAGKGWEYATGGVLYDKLFAINKDGELYLDNGEKALRIDVADKVTNYLEGTNFSLVQFGGHRLDIQRYGEKKAFKLELSTKEDDHVSPIISSAYTRHFRPGNRYHHDYNKKHQDFISKCEITKIETDPWTGKGMGLTKDNELVFEGDHYDKCMKYEVHGAVNVSDFKFSGTSVQEPGTFSTTALEILTDGKWRKIYPYDWRPFAVD